MGGDKGVCSVTLSLFTLGGGQEAKEGRTLLRQKVVRPSREEGADDLLPDVHPVRRPADKL